MRPMLYRRLLALTLAALAGTTGATSATPAAAEASVNWTALGGELGFIWNTDLLRDIGITPLADAALPRDRRGFQLVPLRDQAGLRFAVNSLNFDHFVDGRLSLRGGFTLSLPDGAIRLADASLRPRAGDAQTLDLVDAQGNTWFYLDKLMYAIGPGGRSLEVKTLDLRVHADLAQRLGKPRAAGLAVAQLRMQLNVTAQNGEYIQLRGNAPVWPGTPVPGAPALRYQADVFMLSFFGQYSRCTRNLANPGLSCDGPGGATDGYAVFTPSSTLRNNVNNGTAAVTVPGDPNGTSTALYTADVAWNEKFSGSYAPYDNDQHPYLIWNLYRLYDGKIEQIGRSGMKHAFLTTNQGCSSTPGSGGSDSHILGRSCSDTYGTGNNDSNEDLGPRSEVVPATGAWGRCGSIFDSNCDGGWEPGGNTDYSQRMIVRESQLAQPGSTYLFESWYIVRDDINIYNTMATLPVSFSFSGNWSLDNGTPIRLGPAINRWVDPASSAPDRRNVELSSPEGHARVAVLTQAAGAGSWRYEYAVMNFDFARARTQGTDAHSDDGDPAQRFRVIHNMGFDRFSVPLPAGVSAAQFEFSDGDLNPANDWTASVADGKVTWTAPANPTPPANVPPVSNPLNWGTLFRFRLVANAAPADAALVLHVAESGTPAAYSVTVLGPAAVDAIFADDFEG